MRERVEFSRAWNSQAESKVQAATNKKPPEGLCRKQKCSLADYSPGFGARPGAREASQPARAAVIIGR